MNKLTFQKTIYTLYLICFYIFTYGKFIIIFLTIVNLLLDLSRNKISLTLYRAYRYTFIIFFIFMLAFFSAVIQGNDILHIVRNNFYTIVFIIVGIQIGYIYRNNFTILMEDTIKIVSFLALVQIIIYIASIVNLEFHLFVNDVLSAKLGYSIAFAGLGEYNSGFGLKMVTNITSLYLFLIPYAFYTNNEKLKKYSSVIIVAVIISVSLAQYAILIFYLCIYYVKSITKPYILFKKIFSLKFIMSLVLIIYFLFESGLNIVLEEKVYNALNTNTSELTSTTLRIVQSEILFEEFSESFLFGKGLGYDSVKYHKIRNIINGNNEIKYFNYSMYENQYLDILMKFGLFLSLLIYLLFFFYPAYRLLSKYLKTNNNVYFSILVGYIGLTIFAGSNGNTFYAYTTMFIWGLVIYLISTNKKGGEI